MQRRKLIRVRISGGGREGQLEKATTHVYMTSNDEKK